MHGTHAIDYDYSFVGSPNTLLLLHGWGGNKDSFSKIKRVFRPCHNILSVSLPPFEDSITAINLYEYRDMMLDLLKSLGIDTFSIICHSFGFRVALMLATQTNIHKIIVTGGAGIRLKPNFFKKLNFNMHTLLLKSNPQFFTRFASSDYLSLSTTNRQTFKNIVNKDLTNHIKLLHCPIFLFWGGRDTATPIKMLKIIRHLQPNAQYKIIKTGDHFAYLNHGEAFVDCCDKFLNC